MHKYKSNLLKLAAWNLFPSRRGHQLYFLVPHWAVHGLMLPRVDQFRGLREVARCVDGLDAARGLIAKARVIRRLRMARRLEERTENVASDESLSQVSGESVITPASLLPQTDAAEFMEIAA